MKALLDGVMPAAPKIYFALVDVRDVAICTSRHDRSAAQASGSSLRPARRCRSSTSQGCCGQARRRRLPDAAVRGAQLADAARGSRRPLLRAGAPQLGRIRHLSAAKARRLLGWTPRANEEIIVATAESLLRLGLVKP